MSISDIFMQILTSFLFLVNHTLFSYYFLFSLPYSRIIGNEKGNEKRQKANHDCAVMIGLLALLNILIIYFCAIFIISINWPNKNSESFGPAQASGWNCTVKIFFPT